jgi:hypothetical protein
VQFEIKEDVEQVVLTAAVEEAARMQAEAFAVVESTICDTGMLNICFVDALLTKIFFQ